jgi:hypothetical protein
MYVTACKQELDRISKSINQSMDFCGFSAARNTDSLIVLCIYRPFFAPAACWWTFMLVLSILKSCISASTLRISKILSKTPASDYLLNLSYSVLHELYRSGKSLQDAPLRAIHRIPFGAIRLSPDGLPGFPVRSGGSMSLTTSHSSSHISYLRRFADIISPYDTLPPFVLFVIIELTLERRARNDL